MTDQSPDTQPLILFPTLQGPSDGLSNEQWVSLAGGKADSLRRMALAGLAVPPGFTLTTTACRRFLSNGHTLDSASKKAVDQGLVWLETESGLHFGDPDAPLLLAVRSGAPVSMPGTMKTILSIGRRDCSSTQPALRNTEDLKQDLYQAVSTVFESWLSPAALSFRRTRGIADSLGTAVTIQQMIEADISGVLFTSDPREHDSRTLLLEAIPGLGEDLVGGQVTPCRWQIGPDGEVHPVHRPPLSPHEGQIIGHFEDQILKTLCEQAVHLKQIWEKDLDIEWCCKGSKLWFLQARPVHVMRSDDNADAKRNQVRTFLSDRSRRQSTLWVRHNLSDTLPAPTPLTWSVIEPLMSGSGGLGHLYRQLGYQPSRRLSQTGFVTLIAGRIYADTERLREMFCEGYPLTYDREELVNDPSILDHGPSHFKVESADPLLLFRLPSILTTLLRVSWRQRKLSRTAPQLFDQQVVPAVQEYFRREMSKDLSRLCVDELQESLRRRHQKLNEFFGELLIPGTLGAAAWHSLQSILRKLLGNKTGNELSLSLLNSCAVPLLERKEARLTQVQDSPVSLEMFLHEFGHRGPGEMELANPRWKDNPNLLSSIPGMSSPGSLHSSREPSPTPEDLLLKSLTDAGIRSLAGTPLKLLGRMQQLLPYRELGRHYFMLAYSLLRDVIEALAKHWELVDQIYFLTIEEILRFESLDHPAALAHSREEDWKLNQTLSLPAVIDSTELNSLFSFEETSTRTNRVLQGTPLSSGTVTGTACHLRGLQTGEDPAGKILVCSSLDPGALPVLCRAAGIIVGQGGVLSHGAVLARQFGIPAVMLLNCCLVLGSGDEIRIDGQTGEISVLESVPC